MKALSIRQPWAWLIIAGKKDIENRSWRTSVRGRIAIHASRSMTKNEYASARDYAETRRVILPDYEALLRGGLIGTVDIVDCVTFSQSKWFEGPYGFVLLDPRQTVFVQVRGKLGFFEATP